MPTKKRKSRAKKEEADVTPELSDKQLEEMTPVEETPKKLKKTESQPEQPQVEEKMVQLVALQNWPLRDGRFAHEGTLVEVPEEYAKVLLTQTRAFKLPSGDEAAQ